ncbi:cobyrinic acid a,c-diamide synthase (plasmid) [Haloferax mediterranei ATCC 33500]|uniref:Cobyrinate a,c-diamide synthase n=1 Tax=Haloferax mediterranei (strain ATCC 33500 / DSM 1411 / JCM 8866 / NBRC 14739 / NCIMB 2177 / R-4) TaxID=523841 RepID=I3R9H8_HALMT|nr:cobyrinic acid a,c-diamide synthase [Haloferax mediterranei]AFK20888.1 cobyrinic acid a,c-diamide synthase [Haloferax mediterranei ATCC 33500]AHZ24243.1 cobyrinic acid a,c-diamide synthase [Haloferax mediterranei ATCC 33500]EMA05322.1 cobyrinic acid a,c-diamide synthase [Haloferax mediterranei ATCC 33500]MDX5989876.1 cobyrinic acid a,c-diamide synthase [Haloferax mediterranei ATCC 33500]QCQ77317.1 cobyrinic acid a,c-diamide synthase [Haloferax mediterranei ATCC 33500]
MDGFVLAGTKSGVGKTVATLAIIQALQDDGYSVQPAKAGPDFIDPSHHEQVAGRPSRTLDLWLEGEDGVRRNFHRGDGDICIVEGVMGLYDGDCSSTAMVADALDIPVVLVVDAKAGMESVAATAHGFREYAAHAGRDIDVAGIIAQRAHGGRHEEGIKGALPDDLAYFGRIPPRSSLEIPDRHLGLHMGDESPLDTDVLSEAAAEIRTDRLVTAAREPPRPSLQESVEKTGSRVAVARDSAFCFAYPATVEELDKRADVVTFSPVAGDTLPDCDGVYLPGGYPELHGPELDGCPAFDDIAARAAEGLPVFGECGGLMALTESLTTDDGTYEMAGVLPADVQMCDRYQALDHVELRAKSDTLTAGQGSRLRGHEFHYSRADVDSDARFAFDVVRGSGIQDSSDGLMEYQTLGTYCHVHAESGAFETFVGNLSSSR